MAHFGLRLGCWQRDCSATNGGPPELDYSNKGTGSSIRVDARWTGLSNRGRGREREMQGKPDCLWQRRLRGQRGMIYGY